MKHKILISIPCGPERERWINPQLFDSLIALQWDARFSIFIRNAYGFNRYETARNWAMKQALDYNPDALCQIDNDMTLPAKFADILHESIVSEKDVVGLPSARALLPGGRVTPEARVYAGCVQALVPSGMSLGSGAFHETEYVGTGVMIIRSEVWRKIPRGPWFKWVAADDELSSPIQGEDYAFCDLVRSAGLKVWSHGTIAGHLKTIDITSLIREVAQ